MSRPSTGPDADAARADAILADVLGRVVGPPRRRQALVVAASLRGRSLVRAHARCAPAAGPRTLFEIGSITKVFTALALAAAAERGLVGLEEPLAGLLPPGARVPANGGSAITLAHLASHSAGLPSVPEGMPELPVGRRRRERQRSFTVEDLFAALGSVDLRSPPGRRYRYSSFGSALLGHVLARRAGTTWEELVRTSVCEPLGLRDTAVAVAPGEADRPAPGHTWLGRRAEPWDEPALAPAGALRSTADDLTVFLRAFLGDAPASLAGPVAATLQPRVEARGGLSPGLGWHLLPLGWSSPAGTLLRRPPGPTAAWHNGTTLGFGSFAGLVREADAAVVVLASRMRLVTGLGIRLLRELAGAAARSA